MAAPIVTRVDSPDTYIAIADSNTTAGTYTYQVSRAGGALDVGFNICTGTLTACDIKVKICNLDSETPIDVTNDLFGVAILASDSNYLVTIPIAAGVITLEVVVTAPANDINFSFFAPRG